jgi:hypothetical protein
MVRESLSCLPGFTVEQSETDEERDFGATFVDSGGGKPRFCSDLVEAKDRV